jgi:hypothetical protein
MNQYDQFGRPIPPGYGAQPQYGQPMQPMQPMQQGYGQTQGAPTARIAMPVVGEMGGQNPQQPSWVRFPFFPTAPYYSTNPNVGYQIRYYSTGILSTDSDVAVGSETVRTVQFDIPARIIAINASCVNTAVNGALPVGVNPRDCFLFRIEYTTGDRLHIQARLGSTVVGTADNPGELGGTGYTVDQGAALIVGITPINPIPANFRIDVTFHALELRGSANFVGGR